MEEKPGTWSSDIYSKAIAEAGPWVAVKKNVMEEVTGDCDVDCPDCVAETESDEDEFFDEETVAEWHDEDYDEPPDDGTWVGAEEPADETPTAPQVISTPVILQTKPIEFTYGLKTVQTYFEQNPEELQKQVKAEKFVSPILYKDDTTIVAKHYILYTSISGYKVTVMCKRCGWFEYLPVLTSDEAMESSRPHIMKCYGIPDPELEAKKAEKLKELEKLQQELAKKKLTHSKFCQGKAPANHVKCDGVFGLLKTTCECVCHKEEFPDEGL